jgi:hypothetical protein
MEAPPSFQGGKGIREVWGNQTQCMGLKSQFSLVSPTWLGLLSSSCSSVKV